MSQTEPALAGLRLLLTRPAGQADEWQSEFLQLGATLRHVPVIAIESLVADEHFTALFKRLQHFDIGIFVSTNAVRHAHSHLLQQQLAIPAELMCYAVGDNTTSAAAAAGFSVRASGAVDSETLLALPELQSLQGKRVLIFRGQGGRELITQSLCARGAEVVHAELYRRGYPEANEPELVDCIKKWQPHAVAATSVAGVHNLIRMAQAGDVVAQLQATPLLAPGARVTEAAQEHDFSTVLTARSMRLTDVSYALCNWWRAARTGAAPEELKKAK